MSIFSQPSFFQFHLEEMWGMDKCDTVEPLKMEVKLLLSANSKTYMPHLSQLMTLSDLDWPFRASRTISAVVELLV